MHHGNRLAEAGQLDQHRGHRRFRRLDQLPLRTQKTLARISLVDKLSSLINAITGTLADPTVQADRRRRLVVLKQNAEIRRDELLGGLGVGPIRQGSEPKGRSKPYRSGLPSESASVSDGRSGRSGGRSGQPLRDRRDQVEQSRPGSTAGHDHRPSSVEPIEEPSRDVCHPAHESHHPYGEERTQWSAARSSAGS
jgi:hypothetical protein